MFLKPYPTFSCPTGDGHNFVLNEPLVFVTTDPATNNLRWYRSTPGAQTDGASTPQAIWNLYPPFGKYWLSCILHDCAYRGCLETSTDGKEWKRIMLPKDDCDSLLLEAMIDSEVDQTSRRIIFEAVKNCANSAYTADAAMPIQGRTQ